MLYIFNEVPGSFEMVSRLSEQSYHIILVKSKDVLVNIKEMMKCSASQRQ
jgi:hypothetical protein